MKNSNSPITDLIPELRRGVIVLAVLSQLDEEQYGYSLQKLLSKQAMDIEQGTLYPLLRRLEAQGLVQSNWRIMDDARPRRYYVISPQGREVLNQLKNEWARLSTTLQSMLFQVRKAK